MRFSDLKHHNIKTVENNFHHNIRTTFQLRNSAHHILFALSDPREPQEIYVYRALAPPPWK